MISVFLAWILFSVSFIGGFILCSLIKVGKTSDEVTLTSDYIDWSKVPQGYDWVACDSGFGDGRRDEMPSVSVGMYKKEPRQESSWWETGWEYGKWISDPMAIIGPLPPWKESLRKRPEVKS